MWSHSRGASLEVLRAEARDELDTVIMDRCRDGDDPWEFMSDLPTVDELVVLTLRADAIRADDEQRPTPLRDFRMLRQIALDYPPLTAAVWRLLDAVDLPAR